MLRKCKKILSLHKLISYAKFHWQIKSKLSLYSRFFYFAYYLTYKLTWNPKHLFLHACKLATALPLILIIVFNLLISLIFLVVCTNFLSCLLWFKVTSWYPSGQKKMILWIRRFRCLDSYRQFLQYVFIFLYVNMCVYTCVRVFFTFFLFSLFLCLFHCYQQILIDSLISLFCSEKYMRIHTLI